MLGLRPKTENLDARRQGVHSKVRSRRAGVHEEVHDDRVDWVVERPHHLPGLHRVSRHGGREGGRGV